MSIRLCQACLHEVKEGDKLCSNCMISVNRHATVIEVMSEYEGFSYVSNRYAFHDENLNNYNAELLKDTKNSRLYPDNIKPSAIVEEDFEYVEEDDGDFTKNIIRMINSPKDYIDVIYGLLGCILLLIGNFLTIYSNINDLKNNNSMYLNYITIFIIGAACLAILLVFKHKKKYVLIPTIIVGIMLIFVMSDAENFQYLGFGYYIMWISLILLVACASVNTKSRLKKYFLRKTDLTWIMLTFFVSLGLVNTFNYKFGSSAAAPEEGRKEMVTDTIRLNHEEIKTITINETKTKLEVSLLDTYLVRNHGKDLVVVEMSVYNNGKKEVKIKDCLDIYLMQNKKKILMEKELEGITYFNTATGNEKIGVDNCKTMFYAFYVDDLGDSYLNVINKEAEELIINQIIVLNQKFYVKEEKPDKDIIPVGDGKGQSSKEKDSYTIYFKKPASWSEKIYAYIYCIEDDSIVEINNWPGMKMTKDGDIYKISYDKKWYGKGKVMIVDKNNQDNMFPEKESLGLKLEGNINIMPNE
ncbi:MAG: starch-binding protein [Lachnospiraceae bacterium]|nr:starch-binding protein [Lachnospiraceae bacterium]